DCDWIWGSCDGRDSGAALDLSREEGGSGTQLHHGNLRAEGRLARLVQGSCRREHVGPALLSCCPHAKDPGEHRCSESHREVGKIKGPEAMSADSDIDEIDHSTRGANTI